MRAGNQWGSGTNNAGGEEAIRDGVYFVQTGPRFFRVACTVENHRAFLIAGTHHNKDCRATPIAVANPVPSNVKVCRESDDSTTDFIEKALKRRSRFIDRHPPTSRESFAAVSEGYDQMKNNCSSLISSDHGAKSALRKFGENINDSISDFNRRNPTGRLPLVTLPAN